MDFDTKLNLVFCLLVTGLVKEDTQIHKLECKLENVFVR